MYTTCPRTVSGPLKKHIFNNTNNNKHLQKQCSTKEKCNSYEDKYYDLVVVGGGIIGSATSRLLLKQYPKLKIGLLEKEAGLALHQSGRNSGVIHAGIYYTPGSLKAKLCVEGLKLSYEFLKCRSIPHKRCGKLIVATNDDEIARLKVLLGRARQNDVPGVEWIDSETKIREIEPYCRGLKAVWSPNTGIVDWAVVTQHLGWDFTQRGGEILLHYEVNKFEENDDPNYPVRIRAKTDTRHVFTKYVLTCAGLQADLVAKLTGASKTPQIVPFRGEYLVLKPHCTHMITRNIYPVPDPRFPFLGVHFTPRMDGGVWLGPSAVLAFAREGYTWTNINVVDLSSTILYPGFRKFAGKFLIFGLNEMLKSIMLSRQIKELQKFVPDLNLQDVMRGPAGVRAQALNSNGDLVDDFAFDNGDGPLSTRILHCRNAPSPAATSSLAIARLLVQKLKLDFKLDQFK